MMFDILMLRFSVVFETNIVLRVLRFGFAVDGKRLQPIGVAVIKFYFS